MLQSPKLLQNLPQRAEEITARLLHYGEPVPDNKELAADLMTISAFLDGRGSFHEVLQLAAARLLENQVVLTPPSDEGLGNLFYTEVVSTHQVKHFFGDNGQTPRIVEITADQFGNQVRKKALGVKSSEAWLEEHQSRTRR